MGKDLTNSKIDRQNVLNNDIAVIEMQKEDFVSGIEFEGKIFLTKDMLSQFFGVDIRTIERYTSDYQSELKENGYELLKGKKLKQFINVCNMQKAPDISVGTLGKFTTQLSIYDFRAFLNIAMLMVESESAKMLRQRMLDIVLDIINKKTGGATKYINQRDFDFHLVFSKDENYHKNFTDAMCDYTDMPDNKYGIYTNKIYQSIFRENAEEYRKVLSLKESDNVRKTLYAEVLKIVHAYECGLADELKKKSESLDKKLNRNETEEVFLRFESQALWKPLIFDARVKMSSRDLALRDAFHNELAEYTRPLEQEEFERFLGSDSDVVQQLMERNAEVFKRLKERE
ncbi:MAG: DNA-binding protein [Christensenellaceae bacterium]